MRLTTKGRFAVTAMIDLARSQGSGPVSLAAIASRQDISVAYLEQLFSKMRRAGLVSAVKGPGGGYLLVKTPAETTVKDIVLSVDEPLDTTRCGGACDCAPGSVQCVTHDLWSDLNDRILDYLSQVTLASLSEKTDRHANGKGPAETVVTFAVKKGKA